MTMKDVQRAFDMFDMNKDGLIDLTYYERWLRCVSPIPLCLGPVGVSTHGLSGFL